MWGENSQNDIFFRVLLFGLQVRISLSARYFFLFVSISRIFRVFFLLRLHMCKARWKKTQAAQLHTRITSSTNVFSAEITQAADRIETLDCGDVEIRVFIYCTFDSLLATCIAGSQSPAISIKFNLKCNASARWWRNCFLGQSTGDVSGTDHPLTSLRIYVST